MTTRVLVTGAGGFIGHHLVTVPQGARLLGPRRRPQAARVHRGRRRRVRAPRPAARGRRRAGDARRDRRGLRPRGRHGRHGLHLRAPRRDPAQQLADQPPHARGRPAQRRVALPLQLVGLHLSRVPPDRRRRQAAPRGGRLPGPAAGRLRLGEARHREAVRVLRQRLRDGDADRPVPQHLRAVRDLRRRPREGAGRHGRKVALRRGRRRDRDLGRRRADPLVLPRRRLRRRASTA